MMIITKCGVLLPLWLCHWIMRMRENFQNRLSWVLRRMALWDSCFRGCCNHTEAEVTDSCSPPAHWGVIPGSDPSPVQRQQIAVHIIAMRRGWRQHCLRPPNHQLGQRVFFLIPVHPGIPKTFSIGPPDYAAHNASQEVKSNFLFFTFPLRTAALSKSENF